MFQQDDELDRVRQAEQLGFKSIEWLFPYNREIGDIKAILAETNLKLILINTALGNPQLGERGIAALPHRTSEFQLQFNQALEYATQLHVPLIHVMAGIVPTSDDRASYVDTFVQNLDWAVQQIKDESCLLLIEPLNREDTPNYLHATCEESQEILQSVNGRVYLQFDFYHLQIMGGNLVSQLKRYFAYIRHIQFSSVPGRHEPQHGEVNCDYLFKVLLKLGYSGYIGCEYTPKTSVEEGLGWADNYNLGVELIGTP